MLQTPIVFLIFNRPDLSARVFEAIRAQKPRQLLVVADGPRHQQEAELCRQTRMIIEGVDWPCEVLKNYSETNLGCKKRVSSGLDWAFETVETAIILEDDCLPHPDFFRFCETMLERYRADERVMHISGDQFVPDLEWPEEYGFSRYIHIWGWASWRRAWAHYDVEMKLWPRLRENILASCANPAEALHWDRFYSTVHAGKLDTWDAQWSFACAVQLGLAVVPRRNLISNIGFRADATHTNHESPHANMAVFPWSGNALVPVTMMPDARAEAFDRNLWSASPSPLWKRAARRAWRIFRGR